MYHIVKETGDLNKLCSASVQCAILNNDSSISCTMDVNKNGTLGFLAHLDFSDDDDHEVRAEPECSSENCFTMMASPKGKMQWRDVCYEVCTQLRTIHLSLRDERLRLQQREQNLNEREALLDQMTSTFETRLEKEVNQRQETDRACASLQLGDARQATSDARVEVRRLQTAFQSQRDANVTLRDELETLRKERGIMQRQLRSQNARLQNLQKNSSAWKKRKSESPCDVAVQTRALGQPSAASVINQHQNETLAVLLEWICDSTRMNQDALDFCLQLLPSIVEIVRGALSMFGNKLSAAVQSPSASSPRLLLPSLRFVLATLSLLLKDEKSSAAAGMENAVVISLRRLGEELLSRGVGQNCSSVGCRLAAQLLALRVVTQADVLLKAADLLCHELRHYDSDTHHLFLSYDGVSILLALLSRTALRQQHSASLIRPLLDALLVLSSSADSNACSQQHFWHLLNKASVFAVLCDLLDPYQPLALREKSSVLLQRLVVNTKRGGRFHTFLQSSAVLTKLREAQRHAANSGSLETFVNINLESILNHAKEEGSSDKLVVDQL